VIKEYVNEHQEEFQEFLKKRGNEMSYYTKAFNKLIEAGVPKWYIRSHLLDGLVYLSRVYVYYNPYDVETEHGWYFTNGICLASVLCLGLADYMIWQSETNYRLLTVNTIM